MSSPVPAAVSELTFGEKLQLVGILWDELASSPERIPLSDSLKTELDRRYQDYLSNPNEGSTWTEVRNRVLRDQ